MFSPNGSKSTEKYREYPGSQAQLCIFYYLYFHRLTSLRFHDSGSVHYSFPERLQHILCGLLNLENPFISTFPVKRKPK